MCQPWSEQVFLNMPFLFPYWSPPRVCACVCNCAHVYVCVHTHALVRVYGYKFEGPVHVSVLPQSPPFFDTGL